MENRKTFKGYCLSIFFILLVLSFSSAGIFFVLYNSYHDDTSIISIAEERFCLPLTTDKPATLEGRKVVVLRLDDVQPFVWSDVSMKLMDGAFKYHAPIVAGVIPKDIQVNSQLVHFLKRNRCNIEIAMHGFDHSGGVYDESSGIYTTEFGNIDYHEAIRRIDLGKKVLESIFGRKLTSFIPPYNVISEEGKRALHDEGFLVNSSEGKEFFDYTASPYNFVTNQVIPVTDVIQKCNTAFEKGNHCIIMLHPQEYADAQGYLDKQKYTDNYMELLQKLSDEGVTFTTFEDIVKSGDVSVSL